NEVRACIGVVPLGTRDAHRPIGQIPAEGSVGARRLRRLERQRLGRMPARADAGNAHAPGEVAIGKAHPRAAEAALIELLELKARPDPQPPERPAAPPPAPPQRPRRQPYRAHRSRAAELDGADDRAVAVDAAGAARAVKTIECEKLAG